MSISVHRSLDRGSAEHVWLHTKYSFSFADYYNPKRMGFGVLCVLNEDVIEPGQGFRAHSHDNMEIVTILLEGSLKHKDSMGNAGIINAGDIQRMSAGTGVVHEEYNPSASEKTHLLQVWIYPSKLNIKPGYEQKSFFPKGMKNKLLPVVSGKKSSETVFINQDSVFLVGYLDKGVEAHYKLSAKNHGVFVFVINGEIHVGGESLKTGDSAEITGNRSVKIKAVKKTRALVIEVPMHL